ncbi:MAG: hypothetical protein H0V18_12125 [Pyrinomonadaceae bacterium]|nr:hypothetical protein [Pyrinomonadaceae bacterium]
MTVVHETAYNFPVPAAARLASLIGMRSDLVQVIAYCEVMIKRYASAELKQTPFDIVGFTTPIDISDWEGLSTAACISYARCFPPGIRGSLDPDLLSTADTELQTLHEFVLDLRNKHIAHSVNSFEENVVTVHIGEHFQSSQEIETVTAYHTRVAGLSIGQPAQLTRLAQWWVARTDEEMTVQRAKLLQIARGTPLSELKAQGRPGPTPAHSQGDVGKRRRYP